MTEIAFQFFFFLKFNVDNFNDFELLGASTGAYEAVELRDGGAAYHGWGKKKSTIIFLIFTSISVEMHDISSKFQYILTFATKFCTNNKF